MEVKMDTIERYVESKTHEQIVQQDIDWWKRRIETDKAILRMDKAALKRAEKRLTVIRKEKKQHD